jgi:Zn-dependent membrane protease YugP
MFLPPEQVAGARRVLTAAAMTYIAATLVSVMYLLYYLGLSRRR